MAEIASAFVTLVPSAKGFGKATEKQIGGEVQKSGSKIGGLLGKSLKAGAVGVAAAAGGAIGTALFKGFGRLQGIDQAEAKLKGLGHTTKGVDRIMTNALASVKGTAFGLDAAATTAAGAVAAGVKPGKELERNLKLVGDAATIAGTDMDSMGSIFNKVAASDMIQGDVLAQLGDAGIPVLQMLGKEMGVSAAEVRKLASQGKIDFATFQDAMESGLGGAALESGNTFDGSLANMQAALGRLGANLLGGVFEKMPSLFASITGGLDSLGPVATRVGEAIGTGFERIGPIIGSVVDYFSGGGGSGLKSALLDAFATIKANVLPVLETMAATFRDTILPAVTSFATYVASSLWPVLQQIWGIISTHVLPIFTSLGQFIYSTLVPAIVNIVTSVGKNLKPVFDALVSAVRTHVLPAVSDLLGRFREWQPTIQRVIGVVVKVAGAVLRFAAAVLGKVLPPVIKFAGFLLGKLVPVIGTVIGWVVKIIGWVVDFGAALVKGGKKIGEFASTIGKKIGEVVGFFASLPGKVKDKLAAAATWLVETGKDIVRGLLNGLDQAKQWLIDKVKALGDLVPGWIKKRLGIASPAKVMIPLGRYAMEGFGKGIVEGGRTVQKATEKALKKTVESVKKQRDALRSELSNLRGEFNSIRDSIAGAFTGGLFDATNAGTFLANLTSKRTELRGLLASFSKLKKWGVDPAFLTQLFASGNGALITQLAGMGQAGAMDAAGLFNEVNALGTQLGTQVAKNDPVADQIAETNRLLREANRYLKNHARDVGREVNGAAANGRRDKKRRGR